VSALSRAIQARGVNQTAVSLIERVPTYADELRAALNREVRAKQQDAKELVRRKEAAAKARRLQRPPSCYGQKGGSDVALFADRLRQPMYPGDGRGLPHGVGHGDRIQ
jgi:hypothetical protein